MRKQIPEWLTNVPNELYAVFENALADGLFESYEDITKEFAVEEAKYIISCFNEGGHRLNELLTSDDPLERKEAREELNELKSYVAKFSKRQRSKSKKRYIVLCGSCGKQTGSTLYKGIHDKWLDESNKYRSRCCKANLINGGEFNV
ncbi:hypothetical protein EDM57_04575 [Brevibacillus gelatini]|uniref:Uncharacterized protein n=1 Tax=Brevibacillus gelatini TaxID=1655277 RepID=A0A3M8B7J1_9BACL|nr:hypothetical protein [Brevibacillus gelatini]RNB59421.1 hypothetical protein EDM57_04575 [Brevibacillus gelatini]